MSYLTSFINKYFCLHLKYSGYFLNETEFLYFFSFAIFYLFLCYSTDNWYGSVLVPLPLVILMLEERVRTLLTVADIL